jgi:plasmid stabilization system protein ParE
MTYALRFLPELEEDVLSGYAWYEARAEGLGEEFLRAFYACANEISRDPLLYLKMHRDFRRRLLRRFPYALYYKIEDEEIIVFGLFHCARDPQILEAKLEKRNDPNRT